MPPGTGTLDGIACCWDDDKTPTAQDGILYGTIG